MVQTMDKELAKKQPAFPHAITKTDIGDVEKEKYALGEALIDIFYLAHFIERKMNRLEQLIDRLSELFEPEFVSTFLHLTELGYSLTDSIASVEQVYSKGFRLSELASQTKSQVMKELLGPMMEGF
jgi:hypothetical protein